jgi:hypothetical protein
MSGSADTWEAASRKSCEISGSRAVVLNLLLSYEDLL